MNMLMFYLSATCLAAGPRKPYVTATCANSISVMSKCNNSAKGTALQSIGFLRATQRQSKAMRVLQACKTAHGI